MPMGMSKQESLAYLKAKYEDLAEMAEEYGFSMDELAGGESAMEGEEMESPMEMEDEVMEDKEDRKAKMILMMKKYKA